MRKTHIYKSMPAVSCQHTDHYLSVISKKGSVVLKVGIIEFLFIVSQYLSREACHEFKVTARLCPSRTVEGSDSEGTQMLSSSPLPPCASNHCTRVTNSDNSFYSVGVFLQYE